MRRYHSSKITKDSRSNDQVYKISHMPEIPKSATDRYIISREGDRLDLLANQFYKEPRMWVVLAIANNLGKGSFVVPSGVQIRLPDISAEEFELLIRETEENR